jgi:NAD(P)-dependent dehydrogenase (short-subunit alcohol dehydrogenase family)
VTAVLVAGGARGIGAAAVRAFRQRGDSVLLADRDELAAHEVLAEQLPGRSDFLRCDFTDPRSVHAAVYAAVEMNLGSLDTVFYNAGILEARPLGEWTAEDWDRTSAVNLRAPFLMAQAAAPFLRKSQQGRIILTSSTGAFRGHAGMPAYHATKAGLLGMVRALADELGPDGVTVNAICPGWVDTSFNDSFWDHQDDRDEALDRLHARIPLRRQALPHEMAGLLMFLASAESSYITGQALVIDGGYTSV